MKKTVGDLYVYVALLNGKFCYYTAESFYRAVHRGPDRCDVRIKVDVSGFDEVKHIHKVVDRISKATVYEEIQTDIHNVFKPVKLHEMIEYIVDGTEKEKQFKDIALSDFIFEYEDEKGKIYDKYGEVKFIGSSKMVEDFFKRLEEQFRNEYENESIDKFDLDINKISENIQKYINNKYRFNGKRENE